MHQNDVSTGLNMPFKIKNWKLALLAILLIGLFTSLGLWQLSRAAQKKILLKSFADRTEHLPLTANDMNQSGDWRFYQVTLEGVFDNAHTILLDNKIYQGKVGYEVYTPFKAKDMATPILVDRGFIPAGQYRETLPAIHAIAGNLTITGMLNVPPTYVSFGKMNESSTITWPLRIEYLNFAELSGFLSYPLYRYVLHLTPTDPAAYAIKWQIVTMGPEKHMGYAVQWFAFAFTLLILSVALNRR
ncbi:MAG: SURF1 family protein [Gammaproteobacteria bacterium]|nr:SURF1 family protein [Gammaproteobacteria bacterium]MCW5583105.1 SURF1 family protein [Gammaproteobacteria bacterium]